MFPEKGRLFQERVCIDANRPGGLAPNQRREDVLRHLPQVLFELGEELARQGIVSLALALPQQKVESVQAAVDFLRQSGMVDVQKIYLFGVDQAAPVMLDAAVKDPQIAGLVALSPPQLKGMDKFGDRKLLLLVSEKDQSGRLLTWAQESAAAVPGSQLIPLPGDGHGTFVFSTLWSDVRQALLGRLQRALEHWQPAFLRWWDEMGPSDFKANDVYLRTAVGVDAHPVIAAIAPMSSNDDKKRMTRSPLGG